MKRGDIFWVENSSSIGSEQKFRRPCIIVSNDACNAHSPCVHAVMLTAKGKKPMPTHVRIISTPYVSTALCEQTDLVDKSRLKECIGHCKMREMNAIDRALKIQFGLEDKYAEKR